jgi:hypothetical protein
MSAAEAVLDFAIEDRIEQDLAIEVKGLDVRQFSVNRQEELRTGEAVMPDPVEAFVAAAKLGMFADSSNPPWQSGAEVLGKQADLAEKRQSWRVRLQKVDRGALRVLTNMLRARVLESISVKTVSAAGAPKAALVEPHLLPYPRRSESVPFAVDYEMPDRASRDRYLHFIFRSEPEDAVTEAVFRALESWSCLLTLGGYPDEDMLPSESIADPEPAFLLDPNTIEQAFPNAFICDDDCYAAVINFARIVDRSLCPLETLLLR